MKKNWKWYVYVIECLDGFYYTGVTWSLENRLEQHRLGKGSKFTSKHGFKELKWVEEYADLLEARTREQQIKDFSRKKKEALWKNSNSSQASFSNNNKYDSILRTK